MFSHYRYRPGELVVDILVFPLAAAALFFTVMAAGLIFISERLLRQFRHLARPGI